MKKINAFIVIAVLVSLSSCGVQDLKPDREIFGNFEPLEWSDDYVFAATNYPQSIQVWNKETGKLVRNYYLTTDPSWKTEYRRSLWIYDMVAMGQNLWILHVECRRILYGSMFQPVSLNS